MHDHDHDGAPDPGSGQGPDPDHARVRFEAIGTGWELETAEPIQPDVLAGIHDLIDRYDRTWSRFRPDSLVSAIAREPGTRRLPPEAGPLLDLYRRLYLATDGAVTPLVGDALERLGYDAAYTLRPSGPSQPVLPWDDALGWDGETLTTAAPVLLDVGAAGKGQLVDLVGERLRAAGHRTWVVDAGGDLRVSGPAIRVGLEHPADPTMAVGVALVGVERVGDASPAGDANAAIAASATNRRAWGDGLHHIIDPVTGLPTRSVRATWAVAGSAMLADGLATALFFTDPARLETEFEFEWVRILAGRSLSSSTGSISSSTGFRGEVFS